MKNTLTFIFGLLFLNSCNKKACDDWSYLCKNGIKAESQNNCFCKCDSGWTASGCEISINSIYKGIWEVSDTLNGTNISSYQIEISEGNSPYESKIKNLQNTNETITLNHGQNINYLLNQNITKGTLIGEVAKAKIDQNGNPVYQFVLTTYYIKKNGQSVYDTVKSRWKQKP